MGVVHVYTLMACQENHATTDLSREIGSDLSMPFYTHIYRTPENKNDFVKQMHARTVLKPLSMTSMIPTDRGPVHVEDC